MTRASLLAPTKRLLTLGLLLTVVSAAQAQEPELPTGVPVRLAERVREEVALRWDVPSSAVVLEFGAPRGERVLDAGGDFSLVGSGSGGHWVLRAAVTGPQDLESVRMRAGVWESSPVASRRIERGEVLLASDVGQALAVRWGAPRVGGTDVAEGWVAQRLIREGELLQRPAVQAPLAVRSGEDVQLIWARGGVGLRAPGRAAGSAPVGQQVFVRTASGKRLLGVVMAPGLVDVTQGGNDR